MMGEETASVIPQPSVSAAATKSFVSRGAGMNDEIRWAAGMLFAEGSIVDILDPWCHQFSKYAGYYTEGADSAMVDFGVVGQDDGMAFARVMMGLIGGVKGWWRCRGQLDFPSRFQSLL